MSEWSQLLKIIIRQEILFDAPYPSLYCLRTFSLKNLFRNCREFQNFTLHVQQRPEFHLTEISLVHLWLYKFTIFQWVKLSSLNENLRYQILPAKLSLRSNWSSNWKGTLSLGWRKTNVSQLRLVLLRSQIQRDVQFLVVRILYLHVQSDLDDSGLYYFENLYKIIISFIFFRSVEKNCQQVQIKLSCTAIFYFYSSNFR